MSSSVLYDRLDELSTARLIDKDPDGRYTLTDSGKTLGAAIASLDRWANDWAATQ
jgi:DNA-binding HxlR family transcriptional regulator